MGGEQRSAKCRKSPRLLTESKPAIQLAVLIVSDLTHTHVPRVRTRMTTDSAATMTMVRSDRTRVEAAAAIYRRPIGLHHRVPPGRAAPGSDGEVKAPRGQVGAGRCCSASESPWTVDECRRGRPVSADSRRGRSASELPHLRSLRQPAAR